MHIVYLSIYRYIWEDPLEKGMESHTNILTWKIPWIGSLVGFSPWSGKESDTTEQLTAFTVTGVYICCVIMNLYN